MCLTQYAHCHNYSNTRVTPLLRKVLPQKTELIVTRYLPDVVRIEGNDKCSDWMKVLAASLPVGFCDEWKRGITPKIL